MEIIGAGMAGLLAGGMIRDRKVTIHEAAGSLPNNHSAVLRFRTTAVGDALDISFRKVKMMKTVHSWRNPVADALAYSVKTNGTATLRSATSAKGEVSERFIAPGNLIDQMAKRINGEILFGRKITGEELGEMGGPIVSTIPMPVMMKLTDYDEIPEFNYVHGYNINCTIQNAEAYVSVYVPDRKEVFNRISLTGDKLTIEVSLPHAHLEAIKNTVALFQQKESMMSDMIKRAVAYLGLDDARWYSPKINLQQYSKILPIDETARKKFIIWLTDEWNIYSLGRFATWRPGLLMDDVVNDVRVIRKIITDGHYDHRKK
jgi:hypothetical protein